MSLQLGFACLCCIKITLVVRYTTELVPATMSFAHLLLQVFSTIYTFTKNRTIETAPRLAALRVVVEWLQLFLVVFNSKFAWKIAKDSFIWRAVKWLLVRNLVEPEGYPTYISVFYIMSAIILATIAASVWVALLLKGDKGGNAWFRRFISALQWVALIIYSISWVAVLDYFVYMWDCSWAHLAHAEGVYHLGFTDKSESGLRSKTAVTGSAFVCTVHG